MKTIRCAIYTRKSSEEGLEQDFNSLDAQREACSAYILSQASEGWVEVDGRYDDGGLSGGTLDRPALQRLLSDIADGRIDIIVVYKVDRLTRSLLDFSKLVEAFDKSGTSFVSVTQSFNTTTSMGRLTLNMLLSFAQFEREVTAERIRDKLAASKAKGMWMGGVPPVGYQPNGRTLAIDEDEAAIVCGIFARYLEFGIVRQVVEALDRDGINTPERTTAKGKSYGNRPFSRGQIYTILKNPIYVGLIRHRDRTYPGLHEAIIKREVWDRAQAMLADNLQGQRSPTNNPHRSLLAGKVVDQDGNPLTADHATANKVRYRYYVGAASPSSGPAVRIPARQLETAVIDRVVRALEDPVGLVADWGINLVPGDLRHLVETRSTARSASRDAIRDMIRQVRISRRVLEISLSPARIAEHLRLPCPAAEVDVTFSCDVSLKRSGQAVRLVTQDGMPLADAPNSALIRLVALAHHWWAELRSSELNIKDYAGQIGVSPTYVTRVLRLAFLSPKVTAAILAGCANTTIGCRVLTRLEGAEVIDLPWREQERILLAA